MHVDVNLHVWKVITQDIFLNTINQRSPLGQPGIGYSVKIPLKYIDTAWGYQRSEKQQLYMIINYIYDVIYQIYGTLV